MRCDFFLPKTSWTELNTEFVARQQAVNTLPQVQTTGPGRPDQKPDVACRCPPEKM